MKYPKKQESRRWEKIDIGNGETFEVCLKKPTFGDVMIDSELPANYTKNRIETCVVDWRGVEGDDGKTVSFSLAGLDQICSAYPRVGTKIINIVSKMYLGLDGEELKNSNPPSETLSTDGEQTTDTSRDTSESSEQKKSESS